MTAPGLVCYTARPAIPQCQVNLVANPGFQTIEASPMFTLDQWQPYILYNGQYGSGAGRNGGASVKLSITSTESNSDMGVYQNIATTPGTQYYVEFWYYLEAVGPQTDGAMYCQFGDTFFPDVAVTLSADQENWIQVSDTILAPTDSTVLRCYIHGASIFSMKLDDFTVRTPCSVAEQRRLARSMIAPTP